MLLVVVVLSVEREGVDDPRTAWAVCFALDVEVRLVPVVEEPFLLRRLVLALPRAFGVPYRYVWSVARSLLMVQQVFLLLVGASHERGTLLVRRCASTT